MERPGSFVLIPEAPAGTPSALLSDGTYTITQWHNRMSVCLSPYFSCES